MRIAVEKHLWGKHVPSTPNKFLTQDSFHRTTAAATITAGEKKTPAKLRASLVLIRLLTINHAGSCQGLDDCMSLKTLKGGRRRKKEARQQSSLPISAASLGKGGWVEKDKKKCVEPVPLLHRDKPVDLNGRRAGFMVLQ